VLPLLLAAEGILISPPHAIIMFDKRGFWTLIKAIDIESHLSLHPNKNSSPMLSTRSRYESRASE
jgi:hypothetical protein